MIEKLKSRLTDRKRRAFKLGDYSKQQPYIPKSKVLISY